MKGAHIAIAIIVLLLIAGGAYVLTSGGGLGEARTEISELGIQFSPSEDISDIRYEMYGEGASTWAAFTTRTLEEKDPNCGVGALGAVLLGDELPAGIREFGSATEIDGRYVFYVKPQSPCSSDVSIEGLRAVQAESFRTSLDKTVEPI